MKKPNEPTYFYAEPGSDVCGPLPLETLRTAQAAGKLTARAMVSRQQTGPWAELAGFLPTPQLLGKPKAVRAKNHPNYLAYTALSVGLPIVGVLVGIVCLVRPEPLERKLGEHVLAVALLFMIIYYFGYQMLFIANHPPAR
jgi:hypothetical protein